MLMNSSQLLKVNSQKAKFVSMFGSAGLKIDGSTRPGPGLTKNCRGLPIENQMRPPAIRGTVAVTVFPGAPSGIEMSCAIGWPV